MLHHPKFSQSFNPYTVCKVIASPGGYVFGCFVKRELFTRRPYRVVEGMLGQPFKNKNGKNSLWCSPTVVLHLSNESEIRSCGLSCNDEAICVKEEITIMITEFFNNKNCKLIQ